MISIDTNVLIRLLTADDTVQAEKARLLFEKETIYITKTVMLESEWVLRFAYGFATNAIASAFTKLLGQQNVTVEDDQHIAEAITLLNKGVDFADAIHLVCSENQPFATFDKKLKNRGTEAGWTNVMLL